MRSFAILIVIFLVKINLGMAVAFYLLFSLIAPAVDPALDRMGYWILTRPGLETLFANLEHMPVVSLTRFTNTIVTGGFVAGVLLLAPVSALSVLLVKVYRRHIHARIAGSKLVKAFTATPFAQKVGAALQRVRAVWPTAG